jgi:hypothetical protein
MKYVFVYGMMCGLTCMVGVSVPVLAQEGAAEAERRVEKVVPPSRQEIDAAITQKALDWLALVDEGKYAESWDLASPFMQKHYARDHWRRAMSVSIKPLGALKSRTVRVVEDHPRKVLPGGPKASYMIVRFDTVYENLPSADESVTLMYLHNQGGWGVVGYFLK